MSAVPLREREIFRYDAPAFWKKWASYSRLWFVLGLATSALFYYDREGNKLISIAFIWAILISGSLLYALATWGLVKARGEIVVSPDTIHAIRFGKTLEARWADVTRIYQVQYTDTDSGDTRDEVWIASPGVAIQVLDYLRSYASFLELLNEQIRLRNIPAFAVDRRMKSSMAKLAFVALSQSQMDGMPTSGEAAEPVTSLALSSRRNVQPLDFGAAPSNPPEGTT